MAHPFLATLDERVDYIAGIMHRGEWVSYATARELREAWGVALSTIRNYSAMASHALRYDSADKVAMRIQNAQRLTGMVDLALTPDGESGRVDVKAAVAAIAEQNKLLGLYEPPAADVAERPAPPVIRIVTATEPDKTE